MYHLKKGPAGLQEVAALGKIVTDLWLEPHVPKQPAGQQRWYKRGLVVGCGAQSTHRLWGDTRATFFYGGTNLATA